MNKSESKYFNTAVKMDEAFLSLLSEKNFEYISVKEICAHSGVNRSTFYLHYETINDLLLETAEYISGKFYSYFDHLGLSSDAVIASDRESLLFIKPEFLEPYLKFIRDNKLIYSTVLKKFDSLSLGDKMFETTKKVIYAAFERYNVPRSRWEYMMLFYLEGISGIIKCWIKNDCRDSIEDMIETIESCVRPR